MKIKKTIKVEKYPCTFEFKIRAELPDFNNDEDNFEYCDIRNDLLHKHMKRLKVYSYGHAYGDYVVERVQITKDGEIWQLGS